MNYFILRDGTQYGPYARSELRRYLQTGELFPGDLGRGETMKQWLPVSQLLGTAAPPPPSGFGTSACAQDAAIKIAEMKARNAGMSLPPRRVVTIPQPPALNWVAVCLLTVFTCGIFAWAWCFVIARWARAIDCRNKASLFLSAGLLLAISGGVMLYAVHWSPGTAALAAIIQIAAVALFLAAIFAIRTSIHSSWVPAQDDSIALSAAMTLFFNVIYFQFKFNRARRTSWSSPFHDPPRNAP